MDDQPKDDLLYGPGDSDEVKRDLLELFWRVYDRIRAIAQSLLWNPNDTLEATALILTSYEKLLGAASISRGDVNRFLAMAAGVLRWTLVDEARKRKAAIRGGNVVFTTPGKAAQEIAQEHSLSFEEVLTLQLALEQLASVNQRRASIVDFKFYLGMTNSEVATTLNVGPATVEREWRAARKWLSHALSASGKEPEWTKTEGDS
jgi:RNA polymerase sigma factor (TIGR02999 family)